MNQKVEKGSLLGGVLLIAGSAIGGGMLGLPLVTGAAGFAPAVIMFCFCWVFMTVTALLLLEVNLFYGKNINFISMTEQSLGRIGKGVCWATYLFLFFSMLVAYIDASGTITHQFISKKMAMNVTLWQGSLFFTALLAIFVYLGTSFVDYINRFLMLGLLVTYIFLISFGAPEIQPRYLMHNQWKMAALAIPVAIASFGYHNVIPTLAHYLRQDRKKLIQMIVFGGGLPLLVYVLWDWLILGTVPLQNFQKQTSLGQVLSFIQSPVVSRLVDSFAFFAIITSFLAQALALVDFLRDATGVANNWFNRIWLVLFVFIPPFIVAMLYPGLFIKALGLVGGFATVVLFVFLPSFMVWELRYKQKTLVHKIIPGGRMILTLIILIGFCIMALQLVQEIFNIEIINKFL